MKNLLLLALCACSFLLASCSGNKPVEETAQQVPSDTTAATKPPAEFADPALGAIVKTGLDNFSKGDVAAWMSTFADNAVYAWNNGDSLAGKQAISEFWTRRRTEVIDSISFSNTIFLPIKVNAPQSTEAPGNWVLTWYKIHAKYKTGKYMDQWSHTDSHFNAEGKIDRVIQYIDFAPIRAAEAKK